MLDTILTDLKAEGDQLWSAVAGLDDSADGGWRTPTPADGWDVSTQIAHLLWTDEVAAIAATDKEKWDELVLQAIGDPDGFVDASAREVARLAPQALLARWGAAREALGHALRGLPDGPEDAVVRAAHVGRLDGHRPVHGDLGARARRVRRSRHRARPPPTGSGTWPTSGCGPATSRSPCTTWRRRPRSSGSTWSRRPRTCGPGAPRTPKQTVTGSAYDFCLLVTQRVHRDDTDLQAHGADAEKWLTIAQAFAGPAGEGRERTGG